jgi:hypothetical protein
LTLSENALCRRRNCVRQRRAEIDEVTRRPLAVQHLLRAGQVHVVIVGKAG